MGHGVRMGESPGFAGYWRLRLLRGGPVTSWGVLGVWRELAVTHDKSRGSARGGALACAPDLSPQAQWCLSHKPLVPIHHGTTPSFYRDTAGATARAPGCGKKKQNSLIIFIIVIK